jgi:hypothetical protein
MKTNSFARGILKIRVIVFCLAVAGMAGAGSSLGGFLTVRSGQSTAVRTAEPQAPNGSIGDAIAAVRY